MRKRNVIIGVLVIGALALFVRFMMKPDPQSLLRQAQVRLFDAKSFRTELKAEFQGDPEALGVTTGGDSKAAKIAAQVKTDTDRSKPWDTASISSFAFTEEVGEFKHTLTGETRRKDEDHFLKLASAELPEMPEAAQLVGKWVRWNRPYLEWFIPPDEASLDERPLDEAGLRGLREALGALDLFRVTKELPAEEVDGQATRHYAVTLDKDAVIAMRLKLRELRMRAPASAEDLVRYTTAMSIWGEPTGEVWIGKKDRLPRKVALSADLPLEGGKATLALTVLFSRYGLPVTISAPEAEDLESVLGPIFTKRLSLAGDREISATTSVESVSEPAEPGPGGSDADNDGLDDTQELFYGADPNKADTDGDGMKDGEEVDKGRNPAGPGMLFGFGL